MKKIISFISAMLIISSMKAQKTSVQKETIKPVTDSAILKSKQKQTSNSFKKTQKDVKLVPAIKKPATEFKNAPALKEFKKTAIEH
ncbi:MAG: hypothetical protein QM781_04420 [Chitinophagaceae bacterium]